MTTGRPDVAAKVLTLLRALPAGASFGALVAAVRRAAVFPPKMPAPQLETEVRRALRSVGLAAVDDTIIQTR